MTRSTVRQALDNFIGKSLDRQDVFGRTGRVNQDGTVELLVKGDSTRIHVRVDGEQGTTTAYHKTRINTQLPGLPVIMRRTHDRLTILGENEGQLAGYLAGKPYTPLPHDHDTRYSLIDHLHDDRYSLVTHLHDDRYSLLSHSHALSGLDDVTLTAPASGEVLSYNGAGWVNAPGGGGASTLDDLTDVNAAAPTDNYVLTYDAGLGVWVPAAVPPGGTISLDDIVDVEAANPDDGDVLTYDATALDWIPAAAAAGGGAAPPRQSRLGVPAGELSQPSLGTQQAIWARVVALADVTLTEVSAAVNGANDNVRLRVLEVSPPIGNSTVQAVVAETAYIPVSAPERVTWSGLSIALEANKTYAVVCEVESGSGLSLFQSQVHLGQNDLLSPNDLGGFTTRNVGVSSNLSQYSNSLPIFWATYTLG